MTTLLRLLSVCFLLTALCAGAWAQEDEVAFDVSEWETAATRIEAAIGAEGIADRTLEELRAELADWRETLSAAQSVNATQIETLQSQIEALGPAPAEGESEPEAVAERREQLQAELAEAQAPRLRAEEGFARADVLIAQIDREIRERQADAFFELVATPLNPAIWPDALNALTSTIGDVRREVTENISSPINRAEVSERAPIVIALLLAALALIIRGPRWIDWLQKRVEARTSRLGAVVWVFLLSLGEILLPILGLTSLISAVRISGLLGNVGNALALSLNVAIFVFALGRWLARRAFPERDIMPSPLNLPNERMSEGRWLTRAIALLLGLLVLIRGLSGLDVHAPELISVLSFPVFVLLGIALYRAGGLLIVSSQEARSDEASSYMARLGGLLGRVVRFVAVVSPVAAAVGYYNMALGILEPTAISLALIATLGVLHGVVRSAWGLAVGLSDEELDSALVPILVSFILTLLSLPLFALAWGMRVTDLVELWVAFSNGISLGDTRIRPGDFLTFIIVFALGFGATRLLQGALRTSVLPRTRLDKGGQTAIVSGLGYVGLTIAALIGITAAGIDLSSLAIVVGALGVGIGFGLQNIVNNFVSGIIMLIERPVSEGDIVEVGGQLGTVQAISVRSTRIETFDRTDVIVPNGDFISGTVTNWTRGNSFTRVTVTVGVAYASDSRRVQELLEEICAAHPLVAADPPPKIFFLNFGADALEFTCYCILRDVAFKLQVHSELNHEIHARFREEGIEIPFAQRDVWLRNPETLRGEGQRQTRPDAGSTEMPPPQDNPAAHGAEDVELEN